MSCYTPSPGTSCAQIRTRPSDIQCGSDCSKDPVGENQAENKYGYTINVDRLCQKALGSNYSCVNDKCKIGCGTGYTVSPDGCSCLPVSTNTPTNTPTKTPTNTPTRTVTPTVTNTPIVIIPTCPPSSCFTDPEIVYPNTNTTFKAQITGTETRVKNATVTSTGFNCPNPPQTRTDINGVANIYWNCGTPVLNGNNNLTLKYNYSSATDPAILSVDCYCSVNKTISVFPGYLRTEGGDMYVNSDDNLPPELIKMLSYPTTVPPTSLSTYNLSLQGNNSSISLNGSTPSCNTDPDYGICSTNRYILWNYEDSNKPSANGNYYDQIYAIVDKQLSGNGSLTEKTFNDAKVYYNSDNLNYDVVKIKNDLELNNWGDLCTRNTIFLIEGNLYLNSSLTNTTANSACMFVVRGKTTFLSNKFHVVNDQFEAFIITTDFESIYEPTPFRLIIKGGLIVGNNVTFGRNINPIFPLQSTPNPEPSELIIYEGARYIKNLGHILSMPTRLDIQEKLPPVPTYNPNF